MLYDNVNASSEFITETKDASIKTRNVHLLKSEL